MSSCSEPTEYASVEEEDEGRNKILDYIASTGIDVTSEYTYRELELRADSPEHPIRKLYAHYKKDLPCGSFEQAPLRLLGRIPATWWTSSMTAEDCMKIPPAVYSGHLTDSKLLAVFYGAMHGEDIWMKHGVNTADWADEFLYQFCTLQLPYFYLNRLERLELSEDENGYTVTFSKGVESRGAEGVITKNGIVLKEGDDVLLPLDEENTVFIAYSKEGKKGEWNIPDADFEKASVTEITPEGEIPKGEARIKEGEVTLDLKPGSAYALRKK